MLIVEDEPDARELLQELLAEAGAVAHAAASAAEGYDLMRRVRPHVLLSDIGMPGEDGYSFMRRVRALGSEGGGDVPAIAVTAFARPEDKAAALAAGFTAHLTKPVPPAALITEIARLASAART